MRRITVISGSDHRCDICDATIPAGERTHMTINGTSKWHEPIDPNRKAGPANFAIHAITCTACEDRRERARNIIRACI